MRKYYTGIELGTDSIKIVVAEKLEDEYNILASTSTKTKGIKNGIITDQKEAVNSIKQATKKIDEMLGFNIKKVIAAIQPTDCKMNIVVGSIEVMDPNNITGVDISNVLSSAIKDYEIKDYEIITISPISFTVDDKDNIKDPKGMTGTTLESKIVISSIPKQRLYKFLEVLNQAGLETIDVAYTSTGDYFTTRGGMDDEDVGAIINIGEQQTNVSIFNKGIQIKNSTLPVGSLNIDKDFMYLYKISAEEARNLKENFALATKNYADDYEVVKVQSEVGEEKEITQINASKIVEARLREILNLSKNEIKNLTNREIRYIIITGGISELQGFNYLIDDEFNGSAKVCKISTIGIRHNKYSSAYGIIKYFDEKLSLRGRIYSMIDSDTKEVFASNEKKINDYNSFHKTFDHLFD